MAIPVIQNHSTFLFATSTLIFNLLMPCVHGDDAPSLQSYAENVEKFSAADSEVRSAAQTTWQDVCFQLGREEFHELRKQACEKMCASLTSGQPQESALFLLRQLERIGRDESVTTLQKLAASDDSIVADAARRALQNNRSDAAHDAIVSLLETSKAEAARISLINSLGYRAEAKSISVLTKQLADPSSAVQVVAAAALSRIPSEDSAKAVVAAWGKASGKTRDQLAESLISIAMWAITHGERANAATILSDVYEKSETPAVKAAAFQGQLNASGDASATLIVNAFNGASTLEQQLAVGHVRELRAEGIASLLKALNSVSPSGQASLLIALGTRREKSALPAIESACQSNDPVVKVAAITALGHVGTAANVPILLDQFSASDELHAAASKSLSKLFDDKVDAILLTHLSTLKTDDNRAELISILAARNAVGVAQVVVDSSDLVSPNAETRKLAKGVLNQLGNESHISALVTSMATIPATEQDDTAKTIVNICNRIQSVDGKALPVLALYSGSASEHRPNLLAVSGRIGGKAAREFIATKIDSNSAVEKDAAITALCNWPDDSVSPQLMKIAESGETEAQRVRAIRAIARVVVLPTSQHSLEEQLAILKQAMTLATKDDERNLIIDRAKAIGLTKTVEFVRTYITSTTLGHQAERSLVHLARIRELRQTDPRLRADLEHLEKESHDQKLRERAKQLLRDY